MSRPHLRASVAGKQQVASAYARLAAPSNSCIRREISVGLLGVAVARGSSTWAAARVLWQRLSRRPSPQPGEVVVVDPSAARADGNLPAFSCARLRGSEMVSAWARTVRSAALRLAGGRGGEAGGACPFSGSRTVEETRGVVASLRTAATTHAPLLFLEREREREREKKR